MEAQDLDVPDAASLGEALCSADGSDYPPKPKISKPATTVFCKSL